MTNSSASDVSKATDSAFLLTWDGRGWRDVVRLRKGHVTTIGRSATNRIVLRDDSCSRNHSEIFFSDGQWTLRDLGSRNGTQVAGISVKGDWPLEPGQIIEIGACRLAFTDDLSVTPSASQFGKSDHDTVSGSDVEPEDEPAIVHRSQVPEFLERPGDQRLTSSDELAKLFRLGLEMGAARTRQQLTDIVLDRLSTETVADIAAVLLVPPQFEGRPSPADLHVVAYQSRRDFPYRRVSDNLSRIVLSNCEAVLARDVSDHVQLAVFDSLGEMKAASVLCAPIFSGSKVHGLIHLYSTNPDNPLDKADLEFTLAVANQLATAMESVQERESLQNVLAQARNQNKTLLDQLESDIQIIGRSAPMDELRERMNLIAASHASVLIRGESGVGKELIARTIHFVSPRREGPFVCLNCAALNENLLESELFGHEKGAFTGATDRKIGRFEQADRGTLFLDEVGEMSPAIQAKFLRVLEGHAFERVGGQKPIQVDVRVVAATNRDLEEAVEDGEFRKDLYFRLHVAEIHVAPLRERKDDIPLLAHYFLEKFVEKTGRVIHGFTEDAMNLLVDYSWPGNVRELQNTIERTVILCTNEVVRGNDIQLSTLAARLSATKPSNSQNLEYAEQSLSDVEQDHILATLEHTEWNKSRAAQILGIERSTLDRKLKRYHVSRPDE